LERAEREREELARLLRVLRAYSRTPGNMPDSGRDDPLYPVSGYGVRALWDAVNAALTPKEKP
jgi:hypothetical protein